MRDPDLYSTRSSSSDLRDPAVGLIHDEYLRIRLALVHIGCLHKPEAAIQMRFLFKNSHLYQLQYVQAHHTPCPSHLPPFPSPCGLQDEEKRRIHCLRMGAGR